MTDLFVKKTKKEMLMDEIRARKIMRTSEVIRWGMDHFSNRADRDMRQLAENGIVRRMDERMKLLTFGNTREDVWEWVA